jgi:hypothetical protein
MSEHRYIELEKLALAELTDNSQGRRIHARLQAALNYAMSAELAKGHTLNECEVVDGIANGINSMLAMTAANMSPEIALQCLATTNAYFKSDHAEYVAGLRTTGETVRASH